MARNSIIIIAHGIKLDREHKNILNYSTTDMLTLMQTNTYYTNSSNKFSFIRDSINTIDTSFTYSECLLSNYIAFQNPDFSSKWFFAFITGVKYISDAVTRITFEVDEWQTWYDNFSSKICFVEREHVNDDTVGLHTIPENLETGEYITNAVDTLYFNDLCFLVNVSEFVNGTVTYATNVNGVWMAGGFYVFDNITSMVSIIQSYQKEDVVKQVYIVPKFLLDINSYNTQFSGKIDPTYITKTITKPSTVGGYNPVNKKLLTYPYISLLETNNNGSSNIFRYENFNGNPTFSIGGCATVGASIVSIPTNYNEGNETNMLIAGKFPTCSWSEDAYTNWLTMNSVNVLGTPVNPIDMNYIGAGALAIGGLIAGNPLGLIGAGGMVFNAMQQQYQHEILPDSFKGNINGGDFLTASGKNGYIFYDMCIKPEYASIIDKYFSRFGYQVNNLKIPNITGRSAFNYVKIGGAEEIAGGSIPITAEDEINKIFRAGVTVWHNHENIGNFNITNNIL